MGIPHHAVKRRWDDPPAASMASPLVGPGNLSVKGVSPCFP